MPQRPLRYRTALLKQALQKRSRTEKANTSPASPLPLVTLGETVAETVAVTVESVAASSPSLSGKATINRGDLAAPVESAPGRHGAPISICPELGVAPTHSKLGDFKRRFTADLTAP